MEGVEYFYVEQPVIGFVTCKIEDSQTDTIEHNALNARPHLAGWSMVGIEFKRPTPHPLFDQTGSHENIYIKIKMFPSCNLGCGFAS
eukprot:scaffold9737_cov73-Skeletonema_dohrnii-CCMP3373.AAC.2